MAEDCDTWSLSTLFAVTKICDTEYRFQSVKALTLALTLPLPLHSNESMRFVQNKG